MHSVFFFVQAWSNEGKGGGSVVWYICWTMKESVVC